VKTLPTDLSHLSAATSYGRAATARRFQIAHPDRSAQEAESIRFWKESAAHHRRMADLAAHRPSSAWSEAKPVIRCWIDTSGDDVWTIHDTGTLLPSAPLGFGPPRFVYLKDGELLECVPCIHDGFSAWKITNLGSAANV
jgi:hypothetical protein